MSEAVFVCLGYNIADSFISSFTIELTKSEAVSAQAIKTHSRFCSAYREPSTRNGRYLTLPPMHFSALITAFFLAGYALAEGKHDYANVRVISWNIAANIDAEAEGAKPWWKENCEYWLMKSKCRKPYAIELLNHIERPVAAAIISLQHVDYSQLDDITAGLSKDFAIAGKRVKEQDESLAPIDGYLVEDFNPILFGTKHLLLLDETSQWLSGMPRTGEWSKVIRGENVITIALLKDLRTDHVFYVANTRFSLDEGRREQEIDLALDIFEDFRATANEGQHKNGSVIFTIATRGHWDFGGNKVVRGQNFRKAPDFDGWVRTRNSRITTNRKGYKFYDWDEIWVGFNYDMNRPQPGVPKPENYEPYWFMRPRSTRTWENRWKKGPSLSDHRAVHADIRVGYKQFDYE